jgi:hypothetical protein
MIGIKKMNKILLLIFMLISSPLYSDEFTYHCDSDDNNFSVVFDVNRTDQSVILSHSIDKKNNAVNRLNKFMQIYRWTEENNSVWLLEFHNRFPSLHSVSVYLLNFELQTFKIQSLTNVLPESQQFNEFFYNRTFYCYTLN